MSEDCLRETRCEEVPSRSLKFADDEEPIKTVHFGVGDSAYRGTTGNNELSLHTSRRSRRRPLPPSKTLLAMSEAPRTLCPLLQGYLRSVGIDDVEAKRHGTGDDDEDSDDNDDKSETETMDLDKLPAVDDRRRSTLTQKQHDRYLELDARRMDSNQSIKTWKERIRKDFLHLQRLVKAEQQAFELALREFWQQEHQRLLECLLPGSPSFVFAQLATAGFSILTSQPDQRSAVVSKALPTFQTFKHRCSQIIALPIPQTAGPTTTTSDLGFHSLVGAKTLTATGTTFSANLPVLDTMPVAGDSISLSLDGDLPAEFLFEHLHEDPKLLEFAREHKADVVTTAETLACLLQDPSSSRWLLPVESCTGKQFAFKILEQPLPQSFKSPRSYLTRGLKEGINRWLSREKSSRRDTADSTVFSYTLWKLPGLLSKRQLSVLVRDRIRLVSSGSSPMGQVPVKVHVQVEYFPERGQEIPSSEERALWLLDHMLYPGGCSVLVGRVDPRDCKIVGVDQISRAHALVEEDLPAVGQTSCGVSDLWQNMVRVLQAVTTVGNGNHILCLPARLDSTDHRKEMPSISVHEASENDGDRVLHEDLSHAGEVLIDDRALERCFRRWRWSHSKRVPNTFPPSS